jgi:hypothetical protein
MLSEAVQDYVKQIYLLQRREGKATTSGLAAPRPGSGSHSKSCATTGCSSST